jgi:hypothetical protein
MFNVLKEQILKEFAEKGQKVKITHGFYKLEDFHEASGTRKAIPLGKSIFLVKKVSCLVNGFDPGNFTVASKFFNLESNGKNVDLSHTIEMKTINGNTMTMESNFPSVHDTFMKVNYDLTTFFDVSTILKASLEYIKIDPVE